MTSKQKKGQGLTGIDAMNQRGQYNKNVLNQTSSGTTRL
jgi:hypothetical protein